MNLLKETGRKDAQTYGVLRWKKNKIHCMNKTASNNFLL